MRLQLVSVLMAVVFADNCAIAAGGGRNLKKSAGVKSFIQVGTMNTHCERSDGIYIMDELRIT
jgi:hypothetical protein